MFIQVFIRGVFLLFFWLIVDQGLRITVTLRRLIGVTTACSYEHLALRGVPTLLEHLAPWGVPTVLQRWSHTWVFTLGFFGGVSTVPPPHQATLIASAGRHDEVRPSYLMMVRASK